MTAVTTGHFTLHLPGSGLSPLVMSLHSGPYNHLTRQVGKQVRRAFVNSKSGMCTDFRVFSLGHHLELPPPLERETGRII